MYYRFFTFLLSLFVPAIAFAAVMSSANYKIQTDSVNVGGTENSASASYQVSDTLGEVGTGQSSSASYSIYAGYRQMNTTYLAISSPSNVTLSPAINGIIGGTGDGSAAWTVTTDSPGGYTLSIKASNTPALRLPGGTDTFADYTPAGANPDFTWSVAAAASEFGFTPEGADILQKYKDNGATCNAGSSDTTDACWYNLSTANETIASGSAGNGPSGTVTTVKFRATAGASHVQTSGSYVATTTVTAIAL